MLVSNVKGRSPARYSFWRASLNKPMIELNRSGNLQVSIPMIAISQWKAKAFRYIITNNE
jgi:hypothetical protein